MVVRADYKGDVVVETVTGTMWQPGGWIVWTLIWRGHMLLLQPPESLDAEVFLDRWAGAEPSGPSFKVRGRVLCFQEVFAGSAVLSKAFEAAGVKVMEPIEVFEDPHRRQGYREAFDLTLPQVQRT